MSDNYNNGSDNNNIKSTKKENDKHKASASRQKVIDIVNEETHHLRKERNEKKNNNNNVNSQIRRHTSTLTRPERQRPRQTIINNNNKKRPYSKKKKSDKKDKHISFIKDNYDLYKTYSCWELFALIMTFWAPNIFLRKLCRMYHPSTRQAWREKVTLCMLILFMCLLLGLLSFGLYPLLCINNSVDNRIAYSTATPKGLEKVYRQDVVVYGGIYKFSTMKDFLSTKNVQLNNDFQGLDLSNLFDNTKGSCQSFDRFSNNTVKCRVDSPYNSFLRYKDDESCIPINDLEIYTEPDVGILAFEWEDLVPNNVNEKPLYFVYNGLVMDLTRYYSSDTKPRYLGDEMNKVLAASLGKDGTKLIISREKIRNQIKCVFQRYRAGVLSKETVGCMASQLIIIVTTLVVLVVVMIRFTMAIVFRWFIADRLTDVKKKGDGTVVLRGKHPYVAILITCYSEGRKGIKTTLDSLATASYSDRHKLFFIVADGFVKGEGNKKFTPEICKDLLDLSPALGEPLSCSYVAIGEGEKRNNKAKVYAGYYNKDDRHIPTILVVKVGNENEAYSIKSGNRGKRDSQLILMNYFQRVLSNDRFTELDYELYWKIFFVLGITSDTFEMVLMVDADTKVSESSMAYLVSAMKKDPSIVGCCGETKLANKSNSWVTAIQVFEYYVSHHYGKAFESVFGGVTCLPGCFSMFRLKVLKDDDCVPILSSPYVISEYQQNVVTTLHEKNLLLLGEDRYLSTLMLKNFPRRKMMFIPQATCRTTAPETLKVLMSQRRRWINSTFHNLFELLFVNDLCGIACLSMQFVVLLELIGTSVLPGAIFYTSYILISATISDKFDIFTFSLLMLLIGLPAFLSIIVTHKISNIGWMAVYLMALPLWNFMLPVYAYWHFDNFSWGETRRVSGDNSDDEEESIKNKGSFDQSKVALKSLEGWESERQRLEYCVMYHHESITYEHYNGGNTGKVNKSSGNKKSVKNRDKRNNNHHNKSESSKKKEN